MTDATFAPAEFFSEDGLFGNPRSQALHAAASVADGNLKSEGAADPPRGVLCTDEGDFFSWVGPEPAQKVHLPALTLPA